MAPSGATFSPTCVASCPDITAYASSTRSPPTRPRHKTQNTAAPVFGRLLLVILAGILQSAALHARAVARILEATAETFGPSLSRFDERTATRMEAADLNNCHQTSQHPTTCCNADQERSHATLTAVVRTRRRYQQTKGEGWRPAQNQNKLTIPI